MAEVPNWQGIPLKSPNGKPSVKGASGKFLGEIGSGHSRIYYGDYNDPANIDLKIRHFPIQESVMPDGAGGWKYGPATYFPVPTNLRAPDGFTDALQGLDWDPMTGIVKTPGEDKLPKAESDAAGNQTKPGWDKAGRHWVSAEVAGVPTYSDPPLDALTIIPPGRALAAAVDGMVTYLRSIGYTVS